jgi:hypothetical protein
VEVKEKIKRMNIPKGFSIRSHLVHLGVVSDAVVEEDFFDKIISFDRFI